MWAWIRTKIIHGKWAYQRGKSWFGDSLIAGAVGGYIAIGSTAEALALFAFSVLLFAAAGHADKKYLKFPQEEANWGLHLNPPLQELVENVRYLRNACMDERDAHKCTREHISQV